MASNEDQRRSSRHVHISINHEGTHAVASARIASPQPNQVHYHRSPSIQIHPSSGAYPSFQAPPQPHGSNSTSSSATASTNHVAPLASISSASSPQPHPQNAGSSPSLGGTTPRFHPTPIDTLHENEELSQLQRWRRHVSGQVNQFGQGTWNSVLGHGRTRTDASIPAAASSTTAHARSPTLGARPFSSDSPKLSSARASRRTRKSPSGWFGLALDRARAAMSVLYIQDADKLLPGDINGPTTPSLRSFLTPNPNRRRSSVALGPIPALSRTGWIIVAFLFVLGLRELLLMSTRSSSTPRKRNVRVSGRNPFAVINELSPAARLSPFASSRSSSAPSILSGQDRTWKRDIASSSDDRFADTTISSRGDTTAIVLHWKRTDNVVVIVSHLCQYTFFDSIVVWNNNPSIALSRAEFSAAKCPPSKLRIYNSPRNQLFVARYLACAQASTPNCYFQDDDWLVWPLRSMYAQFSRDPQGPVVVHTNPQVASMYALEWCFYHGSDVHTCFAWMGTGAFTSRSHVVEYLGTLTDLAYSRDELAHADNSFTTFLNRPPYVLSSDLTQLPQPFGHSDGKGIARNKAFIQQGIQHLFSHLDVKTVRSATLPATPLVIDVERYRATPSLPLPPNPHAHHVRSPCHTDTCLFLTNVALLPPPDAAPYPGPKITAELETWENRLGWVARGWIEGDELFREEEAFATRWPYAHAVDGIDQTAFRSPDVIKENDYIGLSLLTAVDSQWTPSLSLVFVLEHWPAISGSLVIEVSSDGYHWIDPPSPPSAPICQRIPTQSTLPDHSFPPSPYLSKTGLEILTNERALFKDDGGLGKIVTWFHRRRRRSEGLRRCRVKLETGLGMTKADEGWRFVRLRSLREHKVGWGLYEMALEK